MNTEKELLPALFDAAPCEQDSSEFVRMPRGWLEGLIDNLRRLELDNKSMYFALLCAEKQLEQLEVREEPGQIQSPAPEWFQNELNRARALQQSNRLSDRKRC